MRKDYITSKLTKKRRKDSPVAHIPWTVLKKEIDEAYNNWCARKGIDPRSSSFDPDFTVK
jgi:hypothetical protein